MITTLYYLMWGTVFCLYAANVIAIMWVIIKKKGILKHLIPFFINTIVDGCSLLASMVAYLFVWVGFSPLILILTVLISLAMMITANILLYRLYYKKKNKLTRKEYIITSILGVTPLIIFILQSQLI